MAEATSKPRPGVTLRAGLLPGLLGFIVIVAVDVGVFVCLFAVKQLFF